MIWNFYHGIKRGHVVVARRGLSEVAAIGTVRKAAYYDLKKSRAMPADYKFENFLDVDWHDEPRDIKFNRQVFGQPTVLPISEQTYISLFRSPTSKSFTDEDEKDFPEGKEAYRYHKSRERNQTVIRIAKTQRVTADPFLKCEICGFSFRERYGRIGVGYIEAHHCVPLSESTAVVKTKPSDFAMVCSNCHRMLHRRRPWLEMGNIRSLMRRKQA
jgi:predicted HNH restriction endonuclease